MSLKKNNAFLSGDSIINKKYSTDKQINSNEPECITCGCTDMTEDTSQGLIICLNCGQVSDGLYFSGPDKINYEDTDKGELRYSMPVNTLLPESSIGYLNIVGHGCSKMREIQKWGVPYKERSLKLIYTEFEQICYKNKILKTIEDDAKIMFKLISECRHQSGKNKGKNMIMRGNNRKSIIAACLYNSCKKNKMSKTPKQIAKMFNISIISMNTGCRKFDDMIDSNNLKYIYDSSISHKPYYYIRQVCENDKFCVEEKYIEKAIEISKNIEKLDLITTHTPHSIAVVSVLLMAEISNLSGLSKKKIALLFDITEVTLNRIYKKIEDYKNIVIDSSKTDNIIVEMFKNNSNTELPKEIYERMQKFGIEIDKKFTDYYQIDTKITNIISEIYYSKNINNDVLNELYELRIQQNKNVWKN
jgi:hypothetical protein